MQWNSEEEREYYVSNNVVHPSHYQGERGLEVMDVMENFIPKYKSAYVGAIMFNVIKYILRAPSKKNMLEDMKKARYYLDIAIEYVEKVGKG